MAQYPFEPKFVVSLEQLFEESARSIFLALIQGSGNIDEERVEEWRKQLDTAGYSRSILQGYIDSLAGMSLNDLIELAISDGEHFSSARIFLENLDSREVFELLRNLLSEPDPIRRATIVEILMRVPGRTFESEAQIAICELAIAETDDRVRESLAYAMCHLNVENSVQYLAPWAAEGGPGTRMGIAYCLGGAGGEETINCLIKLSQDPDDDVRDWATFGLGAQEDADTPEIRDALFARLGDQHEETKQEAIFGLSKRGDMRVLESLKEALSEECVWNLAVDSAKELAEPSLLPLLEKLREEYEDWEELDEAIVACKARTGSD